MECWEHPGVEAAGVCARCGKAGCRHCLTMAAGHLFCRSCATLMGAGRGSDGLAPRREPADPNQRKNVAWVGAAAFAIMSLAVILAAPSTPEAPRPPLWAIGLLLPIYAWIGWSLVWTAPPILGWLQRRIVGPAAASVRFAQPGCLLSAAFSLVTVALLWWLLFFPAIVVALIYGLFGGSIVEARRCRRKWAARSAPATSPPVE